MSVAVLSPAGAGCESADRTDESHLIRRARAGDRDAFGDLYLQHRAVVLRFLRSQLPYAPADVEDIAAEAFITALTRIDRFSLDESGRFVNWLLGIARFKALHHRTHRAAHPELELLEWRADTRPADDRVVDPEQVVIDRSEVRAMLARLSPAQQRAVVLQYAAGLPGDEIARGMGITHCAFWKLTERARSRLNEAPTARKPDPRRLTMNLPVAPCACGCGAELPAKRKHNQSYATDLCRHRVTGAVRQQRHLIHAAGSAAKDPALERVLAAIEDAGNTGIARKALGKRTNLTAARLDGITDRLVRRRLISMALEPSATRPVTRYRPLSSVASGRAA